MWVPTRTLLNAIAKELGNATVGTNGSLKGTFLGLVRETFAPTVDSVLGDFTEANFQGYARSSQSVTWNPVTAQDGKSLVQGSPVLWEMTGNASPNTIFGHMLIGSDSVTLLAAEVFNDPIPLANIGDGFPDTPLFGFDPNANYGDSLVAP
jgi:hypothetical protein